MEGDSESSSEVGIAALVTRSLALFESLTLALGDDDTQASQVRLYLSKFKLWAGNLGAHRGSGGRSLEYRLRDASHIRKLVISLLNDLCCSIQQGVLITKQEVGSDTASDSFDQVENDLADYFNDVEDSDKSETAKTLDDVAHVISCLLRLTITINNPSPHSQFLARTDDSLIESYVHWDAKHVREKFDNVSEHLAHRLGRAMARRRLYFKYREEHRDRLAQGLVEDEQRHEQATTVASSLPKHLKEADETCSTSFTIIDDAASDASATSCATANPNSGQLRVPSLPKESNDGRFKCPFCQDIVSIDTRYAWKKHVFRDLRPYVCLSNVCKTPGQLYERRGEWIMHMRREHWRLWQCPFGCNAEYDTPESFQTHIEVSHKHDVSANQIHALIELSNFTNAAKAKGRCPLCFDFQVISDKQYEKHIGNHLEQLALFTLPDIWKDEQGDKGDKEGQQSDIGDENTDSDDEDHDGEDTGMTIEDQVAVFNFVEKVTAAERRKEAEAHVIRKTEKAEEAFRRVTDGLLLTHEFQVATLSFYTENITAAERRKEAEAHVIREAEETFRRRMEEMGLTQEEVEKEIERARIEVEKAARERMEVERQAKEKRLATAREMAELEEQGRIWYSVEIIAAEGRKGAEEQGRNQADEDARRKYEADTKAAAEAREEAQRKAREDYDAKAK